LSSSEHKNRRTPLHELHVQLGARIIDFGGWDMPVQYKTGIIQEHKTVRSAVGLFDVSHMGEAVIRGPRAAEAVQRLITNDVGKLAQGAAMYTVMCHPSGGIVDDCIVYRLAQDEYLIVLNASNTAKDLAWIGEHTGAFGVDLEDRSDATALIAVQGPRAVSLVDRLSPDDLSAVPSFHFAMAEIAGVACMAARTGYTGEDGFELACAAEDAARLWSALLDAGKEDGITPVGLGARDTLRLEARLCLYGNDIDDTTTPYEAGLGWVVKPDAGDFIGKQALLEQKAAGIERSLIGFHIDYSHGHKNSRGIARHGYDIVDRDRDQELIGQVTSGTKGISVDGAIGLGYVPVSYASPGTTITIDCRGKDVAATIVKGKFYKRKG
jgi:aminomethyltransferase